MTYWSYLEGLDPNTKVGSHTLGQLLAIKDNECEIKKVLPSLEEELGKKLIKNGGVEKLEEYFLWMILVILGIISIEYITRPPSDSQGKKKARRADAKRAPEARLRAVRAQKFQQVAANREQEARLRAQEARLREERAVRAQEARLREFKREQEARRADAKRAKEARLEEKSEEKSEESGSPPTESYYGTYGENDFTTQGNLSVCPLYSVLLNYEIIKEIKNNRDPRKIFYTVYNPHNPNHKINKIYSQMSEEGHGIGPENFIEHYEKLKVFTVKPFLLIPKLMLHSLITQAELNETKIQEISYGTCFNTNVLGGQLPNFGKRFPDIKEMEECITQVGQDANNSYIIAINFAGGNISVGKIKDTYILVDTHRGPSAKIIIGTKKQVNEELETRQKDLAEYDGFHDMINTTTCVYFQVPKVMNGGEILSGGIARGGEILGGVACTGALAGFMSFAGYGLLIILLLFLLIMLINMIYKKRYCACGATYTYLDRIRLCHLY